MKSFIRGPSSTSLMRLLSSPSYLFFSIMASKQYSLNLDLHCAVQPALNGNNKAVRSTICEGANINALDAAG